MRHFVGWIQVLKGKNEQQSMLETTLQVRTRAIPCACWEACLEDTCL